MQDNVRRDAAGATTTHRNLAPVSLPSRPPPPAPPGGAHRLPPLARPPTPPPRPESSLRPTGHPPRPSQAVVAETMALGRLLAPASSSSQSTASAARPLLPLPSLLSLSDPLPLSSVVGGTAALSPPASAAVISLTSPRTPAVRQQNLYVEAPVKRSRGPTLQQQQQPGGSLLRLAPSSSSSCQSVQSAVNLNNNNNKQHRPGRLGLSTTHNKATSPLVVANLPSSLSVPTSLVATSVISQQPLPHPSGGSCTPGGTLKKCIAGGGGLESLPTSSTTTSSGITSSLSPSSSLSTTSDSIICGDCGRCRCAACRSPRPLPSAWLCDNSCLLSPESVVDTVSCMCCVKAGLYHCGEGLGLDTREETGWVDNPCTCSPNQWLLRWGCLAAMAVPLPCLCCYPLLGGLTRLFERCYQAATNQGCRCPHDHPRTASSSPLAAAAASSPGADSQKRLLG